MNIREACKTEIDVAKMGENCMKFLQMVIEDRKRHAKVLYGDERYRYEKRTEILEKALEILKSEG